MQKNSYPGKFIVFEGLDGSGSSTQAERLVNNFKAVGLKAHLTKEPTNNIIGGLIRGQLTRDWQSSMECLQLLFAADRSHHLEKEIIPILKEGGIVVSDRYFLSTVAFGSINSVDQDWLLKINEPFLLPDLTILLKVSPKTCLRRIKKDRFHLELFENAQKLRRIWQAYHSLAKKFDGIEIIDGEKKPDEVYVQIFKLIHQYFPDLKKWPRQEEFIC